MKEVLVPITLPFGYKWDLESLKSTEFTIPLSEFLDLPKHRKTNIEYGLEIITNHDEFLVVEDIDHCRITIPKRVIDHYIFRNDNRELCVTLKVTIKTDLEDIIKQYSCPSETYHNLLKSLVNYIHAIFNIAWIVRFAPILKLKQTGNLFNAALAHLMNPFQDRYNSESGIKFILQTKSYGSQIGSKLEVEDYECIFPHVLNNLDGLDINTIVKFYNLPKNLADTVFAYSKILSDIIRIHPSFEYTPIVSLLTAFLEWILKISSEHSYRFRIKIANFLQDTNLVWVLGKIYNWRSSYFHSAKYAKIDNVLPFISIDFLLMIIRKLMNYSIANKIESNTFDFSTTEHI
jgi:hypothetical protein